MLLVAGGHIGLVMLIVKSGWLKRLTSRLAAVGKMTLTCYLATSLICTTINDCGSMENSGIRLCQA
jgi:uncharacterized membrane protein YeiB